MVVMEHRGTKVNPKEGGFVEVFNVTPKNGPHRGKRVVTLDVEDWEEDFASVQLTTEEAVRVASALLTEVRLTLETKK